MELMRKSALLLGLHGAVSGLILAALLLIAAPATAVPLMPDPPLGLGIDNPIWFPAGGANTGIGTRPEDFDLDSGYDFRCVGEGEFNPIGWCTGLSDWELELEQIEMKPAIQFPQGDGIEVSMANPFVADAVLTFSNNTDEILPNTLLVFTNVNLTLLPANLPDPYPNLLNDDPTATSSGTASAFGLDADLLKIAEYGGIYYYGVGELGTLGPGDEATLTVRYIVQNDPNGETMPFDGNGDVVVFPLDMLAATVPEPSTALLLGTGLLGLAVAGKRRS